MKQSYFQKMKRIFMGVLSAALICSSVLMPTYASADSTIDRVTGGSLTIQKPGDISSDELVSRGTARNGKSTGDDGSSITWTLTSAGALTVNGTGCHPKLGMITAHSLVLKKTVTIKSVITILDNDVF